MLRDEIAKYTELSGNDGEHTPIGIIGAYLDGYDKGLELSASKNPNKWIPVSERLPEEDGCYLVAVKFDRYISNEICYFDADDRERPFCPTRTNAGSQYINHGYPIEKTLAWTYSPEPYKAESEDT